MRKKFRKKQTHKTTKIPIASNRIIIISTCVAVIMAAFIIIDRRSLQQSVQGIQIIKGMYNESTISWPLIPGAVGYNIYYGQKSDLQFSHAVRDIPATAASYTIQYLKKGVNYEYRVSAIGLDKQGNKTETWFSARTAMLPIQGM